MFVRRRLLGHSQAPQLSSVLAALHVAASSHLSAATHELLPTATAGFGYVVIDIHNASALSSLQAVE